jgi:hypothetical protein
MTVFLSDQISFEGFDIVARAENIESDIQLWVTDKATGEETLFPPKFFSLFDLYLRSTIADAKWNQNRARQELHNPKLHHPCLIDHPARSNYLLREQDIAIKEGIPALYWTDGPEALYDTFYSPPRYAKDWVQSTVSGWNLVLSGFEETAFGFAAWNDSVAIEKLVEDMHRPEELLAMSALLNPERAKTLVAQQTLALLHLRKEIPQMSIAKILGIIKNAELESKHSQSYIRLLRAPLNGKKIPLAIGIIRPIGPVRTQEQDDESRSWPAAFKEVLESTNQGWRFIEAPRLNRSLVETDYEIWITRIPENSWDTIAPLVELAAGSFRISGGKKF